MAKFLFPLLYLGELNKRGVKDLEWPRAITFKPGPDYPEPYALVTEDEGRQLVHRFPELFVFPRGLDGVNTSALVSLEEFRLLVERVEKLEAERAGKPAKPAKGKPEPKPLVEVLEHELEAEASE